MPKYCDNSYSSLLNKILYLKHNIKTLAYDLYYTK